MSEEKGTYTDVTISIKLEDLRQIRNELFAALQPMVAYKRDPLEFANAAHEAKDKHINKALVMLPLGVHGTDPGLVQCMHGYYDLSQCPDCTAPIIAS